MPELPEVETVRKVLLGWCQGKKIKDIYVYYPKIVENSNETELKEKLIGKEIKEVRRLGKHLIIVIDDYVLLSHLRMEGKWNYGHFKGDDKEGIEFDPLDKKTKENKHVHFVIKLDDDYLLMYHDVRKFGRIHLFKENEYLVNSPLSELGYEPFDEKMTPLYLKEKYKNFKGDIKKGLLDQHVIAGLGNIYVDEVLFASNVLPTLKANSLPLEAYEDIINNSRRILNDAIRSGGSTIKSYHFANKADGKFQVNLKVYGKDSSNCLKCNKQINKTFLNGRGTHVCLNCQSKYLNRHVVAVSGYIASGKSTVSKIFTKHNYKLLDCDKITKDAQEINGYLYLKFLKIFKNYDILNEDLSLNRSYITKLITSNANLNILVKEVTHKYVYNYIFNELLFNPLDNYVLDTPLLFESKINELADVLILCDAPLEVIKTNLKNRNPLKYQEYLKFIELQKDNNDPKRYEFIIHNDKDLENLEINCKKVIQTIDNLL